MIAVRLPPLSGERAKLRTPAHCRGLFLRNVGIPNVGTDFAALGEGQKPERARCAEGKGRGLARLTAALRRMMI